MLEQQIKNKGLSEAVEIHKKAGFISERKGK